MMMTTLSELLALLGKPAVGKIDLTTYQGHTYRCACGVAHTFNSDCQIIREGYLKLLVLCPADRRYLTIVRIRLYSIETLGGLEGTFGTLLSDVADKILVCNTHKSSPSST